MSLSRNIDEAAPAPSQALVERYGGPAPRYTSYPPANHWSAQVGEAELHAALARADASPAPLSLYVHLPFCAQMCRFCGCNVIATRDRSRPDGYLDVLELEADHWAARLPSRRRYRELHLGGGTPTFLSVEQLQRTMAIVDARFTREPGAELSIEIDPSATSVEQIEALARLGFTRISMGVQDLDETVQTAVGRRHSQKTLGRMVQAARAAGFRSVNIDLIYGLPYQTVPGFLVTIARVLEHSPDRLALFGYAHVPELKPNQRLMPQAALPGPLLRAALAAEAGRLLCDRGYRHVGFDHYALPDDDLARAAEEGRLSRGFQGYTTQQPGDLVGLGVSAISDVGGLYAQNHHRLSHWTNAVQTGHLPIERGWLRTAEDKARGEAIAEVLCSERLDGERLRQRHGPSADFLEAALDSLAPLEDDGLVLIRGLRLNVRPRGRMFLRRIAQAFDAHAPAPREQRPAAAGI
ncbi:MAG: oxygen-independent coproporphyrinogen III oxidase [Deltaproteobacteria bacterium]|nr:oxygen-independent coproporphyrinogen III oxidase [Deltaproteobacteria bacterium]